MASLRCWRSSACPIERIRIWSDEGNFVGLEKRGAVAVIPAVGRIELAEKGEKMPSRRSTPINAD
jgi:hypothetical protein